MDATTENKPSLSSQSAWLLFGKVAGFALSFLLPLLTVRYLTQDKVGVYRQAFQVIVNAVSLLPLGFSMSAFYFLNREPDKRPKTIFNILLFNFVAGGLACLTLFAYPQLLGNIFKSDEMTGLAPLIGVVIWLWIFSAFLEIVALANQDARLATVFIISSQFTKTLLMAGAVIYFTTVEAFIYAAIIQGAAQICVLLVYLNWRFPKFWKAADFAFFREQMIYALPFGLAGLLYTIQTDIHNYFVGYRFTDAEYAIYTYGCFELPLIAMLYESISAVMIPRMSELEAQGKRREMLLTTAGAMRRLAFVYFPFFIFLMIVAETFITTLFTEAYAASAPIFRINLLLLPFYCVMIDPVARAFPEVGRFLLKTRIALFFALVSALYFGIRHFDLRGMIGIVVVVVLFERMVSVSKILRVLEARRGDVYLLKPIGKTAAAAIFSGAFLFVFYRLAKGPLLDVCLNFSRSAMSLIRFERGADFVGGGLFLGICFVIFAALYLASANWLGAVGIEDKERIKRAVSGRWSAVRNFLGRGKETKDGRQMEKKKNSKPDENLPTADRRPLTTDH